MLVGCRRLDDEGEGKQIERRGMEGVGGVGCGEILGDLGRLGRCVTWTRRVTRAGKPLQLTNICNVRAEHAHLPRVTMRTPRVRVGMQATCQGACRPRVPRGRCGQATCQGGGWGPRVPRGRCGQGVRAEHAHMVCMKTAACRRVACGLRVSTHLPRVTKGGKVRRGHVACGLRVVTHGKTAGMAATCHQGR